MCDGATECEGATECDGRLLHGLSASREGERGRARTRTCRTDGHGSSSHSDHLRFDDERIQTDSHGAAAEVIPAAGRAAGAGECPKKKCFEFGRTLKGQSTG